MNIFNIILISLILVSLVIIIVIFGRILKRFKEVDITKGNQVQSQGRKGFFGRIVGFFVGTIKNIFIITAEWFVKKIKKILHLVHFWLIKIRKGKKGDGLVGDIEAKKELIIEEEKSLELVINEDLAQSEEESFEGGSLKKVELTQERKLIMEAEQQLQNGYEKSENEKKQRISKITNFFKKRSTNLELVPDEEKHSSVVVNQGVISSAEQNQQLQQGASLIVEDELQQKSEKGYDGEENENFWKKIRAAIPFGKKQTEDEEDIQKGFGQQFSDGVVKIERPMKKPKEEYLIKEVVRTGGAMNGFDQDEELGVDRKILERKILQKVAKDPKDAENYRQLGELYIKMGSFDDADDAYKFILRLSPRDVDAKRKIEKIKLLKRLN